MNLPEEPIILEFDRGKIDLILNNLLSNAIKYSPANARTCTKCYVKENKQTPYLLIFSVKDEGPGIPLSEHEKIFDRFYQLNYQDTKNNVGTGIGLALTKELTMLMGGQVWVESNELGGSTFKVQIPVSSVTSINGNHTAENAVYQNGHVAIAAEARVHNPELPLLLLVEDNAELRDFIVDTLKQDYNILEAQNGAIGIEMAIQHIPDLIFSDLMMPKKNGFKLCSHLKNEQLTAHIPIVLLTARSTMDSKLKGLQTGADDYLTKPFNTIELQTRVQNLIEVRHQLRQKYDNGVASTVAFTENPSAEMSELDKTFLDAILGHVDDHLEHENFTIEEIAEKLFVSRVQLYRKVKALTDVSPSEFVRNYRLDIAKKMLQQKQGNVNEVSVWVGMPNRSYFSRSFKQRFGVSPSEV